MSMFSGQANNLFDMAGQAGQKGGGLNLMMLLKNPTIMGLVQSFGLPILGKLFGAGRDEQDFHNEIKKMLDAGPYDDIAKMTNLGFQMSAPERANIAVHGNQVQNSVGRNLAMSGMNRSGIGAASAGLASGYTGLAQNRLNANIRQTGMDQGNASFLARLRAKANLGPSPSPWQTALGQGFDNFGQYQYLRRMQGIR